MGSDCISSWSLLIFLLFKDICLKLATNGQSDKAFLLTSGFCPQRVVCPCPRAIYMWKNIKKMCIKLEFKEMFLKLATNGRSDKGFLLTSNVCPQGVFCPCPGAYICIKSLKRGIKSDFEEMILKLARYGQREKAFLLSSKFCPQWIVCPSVPKGSGKHGKWLKIIPCMVKIMEFKNEWKIMEKS